MKGQVLAVLSEGRLHRELTPRKTDLPNPISKPVVNEVGVSSVMLWSSRDAEGLLHAPLNASYGVCKACNVYMLCL